MITKKMYRFAMVCATIVVASVLFLGLFVQTSAPVHANALATNLSITYIAVDDQNWNAKKVFTQGDQARFVVYVHNPSNFPDPTTIKVISFGASGFTLLNTAGNFVISGNTTSGYAWFVTIPQNASGGIYYFHAIASDSQGSTDIWATFTVRNHISYNPYPTSQCTWKAEDLMHTATGLYMPNFGDAHSWSSNAGPTGWRVGSTPATSSVIIMQYANGYRYSFWNGSQWVQTSISPYGHVGWVTSIGNNGSMVYVVDRNWNLNGQDGGRWFYITGAPVSFIYS